MNWIKLKAQRAYTMSFRASSCNTLLEGSGLMTAANMHGRAPAANDVMRAQIEVPSK